MNILFTLLVFGEICYLSFRAIQRKQFIFDSEFCERHFFSKGRNPIALSELTFRTRQRIREETEILEPLIAQPEIERVRLLDDAFVDLVIYSGRACSEFADLLKRHEIFDIYLKPQYGSIAIKKVDELFLPNEDTRDPRKILVVGRPGIGKSLLCTKLSRDWSKSDLLRDSDKIFQHLFVFQFRWFNTETMEKISLKQLLSRLYSEGSMDSEVLQHILDKLLKDVNCKLEELDLSETDCTDQGVFHLCEALKNSNCKLTKLDFSGNKLSFCGASSMSVALKDVNCKLTQINLRANDLGNQGVFYLCDALKDRNSKFLELDLCGNGIEDEGLAHLCDALKNGNCSVTDLDLSCNAITGQGVSYLQNVLKDKNCKLLQLNLPENQLRNPSDLIWECFESLIRGDSFKFNGKQSILLPVYNALRDENCKLVKLNLSSTCLTDDDLFTLCSALKDMHCKLTVLYLDDCVITDEGLQHLCIALKDVNCKLTELFLGGQSITDQGISLFFTAVRHVNCKLTKLGIYSDEVAGESFFNLFDALEDKDFLTKGCTT